MSAEERRRRRRQWQVQDLRHGDQGVFAVGAFRRHRSCCHLPLFLPPEVQERRTEINDRVEASLRAGARYGP